ncbi:outer membrane protein assembly factor BamC [Chitinivorax sp. B]|uniref:outer membrane protein assembly factor BamC n=1 Tax=Chitinivorax sp. B TaxID=2502235 RepID=UPI0010F502A0|nr:outer membrane protein assembly factor BamC [Chitinivorax sp. B]
MKTTQLAASLTAACLIAACSTPIETKKIDYRNPNNENNATRSLEVPPDLTSVQSDNTYSIPQAASSTSGSTPANTVANSNATAVLPDSNDARIERQGNQRWLVINRPADQVWKEVQEFWKNQGFTVAAENPATGILETDWQENRAKLPQDIIRRTIGKVLDGLYSTGERDKFRTRLEKGAQAGTTEVYITHRGMIEVFENAAKDRTIWQPRAADPELETEMLTLLQQRFTSVPTGTDKAVSATTKAIVPTTTEATTKPANAMLVADNLIVLDSFDRAWRRIGLGLDRSGFTVIDRDRLHGIYYIRYADPDAKRKSSGWTSIFSSDKGTQAEDYRLEVTEAGSKSAIRVLDKNGKEDRSETARRILQLLVEQLK